MTTGQADLNGVRLQWREAGEQADRVLLMVHGFPFHSAMWEPQLSDPPPGWRMIAPDLRGFGGSERGTAPISMDAWAQELAALLAHVKAKKAVVCGLSMGGYVSFALVRLYPALVQALVLCDTRADPDSAEAKQARMAMIARIRQDGIAPLVEGMLPRVLSRQSRGTAVETHVRGIMESTQPASAAAALQAMAARPDFRPGLRSVNVPTLIIVGSEDVITPPGESRLMARAIPGATIDIIPDASHLPNLEQPRLFNLALHRFMNAVP